MYVENTLIEFIFLLNHVTQIHSNFFKATIRKIERSCSYCVIIQFIYIKTHKIMLSFRRVPNIPAV